MKVFLTILSILYINSVGGYVYKPIEELNNITINRLDFDQFGNMYAVGIKRENHQDVGYKLNPQNEIVAEVQLPNAIYRMAATKQGDLNLYLYSDDSHVLDIGVWRSGSTEIQMVDNTTLGRILFFLDEADNLYYCKENGIQLLRPNTTTAMPIQNLENFDNIRNSYAINHEGNIFLEVTGIREKNDSIAFISKDEAQQEPPYAEIIIVNEKGQYTEGLTIDKNDDLWIFTTANVGAAYIKKFSKGNLQTILLDEKYFHHYGTAIEDRILVVATADGLPSIGSFYFISLDGTQFIEIPDLTEIVYPWYSRPTIVADSEANIYLRSTSYFTPELGPLVLIKRNETKVTPIRFNTNITDPIMLSDYLLADQNDDLWMLTHNDGVYLLKKGETTAEKIPSTPEFEYGFNSMVQNPVTKQIFVARYDALFVIADEE